MINHQEVFKDWLKTNSTKQTAENFNCSRRTVQRIVKNLRGKEPKTCVAEKEESTVHTLVTQSSATIVTPDGVYTVLNAHNPELYTSTLAHIEDYVKHKLSAEEIIKIIKTNFNLLYELENQGIEVSVNDGGITTINGTPLSVKWRKLLSEAPSNLIAFFKRLATKTSLVFTDNLYEFLKHNSIYLNEKGQICAYKYLAYSPVLSCYVDDFTKSIKQAVGTYVEMPRHEVDSNPENYCSQGLHVGSYDYVKNCSIIAEVIINPEDVVAVPEDCDGQKMRCCKYFIKSITDKELGTKTECLHTAD